MKEITSLNFIFSGKLARPGAATPSFRLQRSAAVLGQKGPAAALENSRGCPGFPEAFLHSIRCGWAPNPPQPRSGPKSARACCFAALAVLALSLLAPALAQADSSAKTFRP